MRTWILFVFCLLLLGGCKPSPFMKYQGMWNGEFVVEKPKGEENFKGFVQLYQDDLKFTMELHAKKFDINASGTWIKVGTQIQLIFADFKVNPKPGMPENDMKKMSREILQAYGHEIDLDLSTDEKKIKGTSMTFDGYTGYHQFEQGVQ